MSTTQEPESKNSMLHPIDFFAVYGEMLGITETPYEAWLETEREFNRRHSCTLPGVVFRRFVSFKSFQASYNHYRNHGAPSGVEVKFLFVGDVK